MVVNVTQQDRTLRMVMEQCDLLTQGRKDRYGNIDTGYDEGYTDALDRIWAYCRSQLSKEARKQLDQQEENQ